MSGTSTPASFIIDPATTVTVVETVESDDPSTVSVTSCLFVISVFVLGGAILFSVWEAFSINFLCHFLLKIVSFFKGWGYIDGSYFCFTSLLTIGFGDLVPGQTIYSHSEGADQDAVDSKLIL